MSDYTDHVSSPPHETELNQLFMSLIEPLAPDPIEDMYNSKALLPICPDSTETHVVDNTKICAKCQDKLLSQCKDFTTIHSFFHYLADHLRGQKDKKSRLKCCEEFNQ